MARILVVEDSVDLARALRTNLELEGHEVGVALDGERGLALVRSSRPDLIVLDLMLPKMDGYLLLRAVRGEGLHMPVLILTARSDEAEKVRGFRWGADDYVTKPFSVDELLARLRAVLRRRAPEHEPVLTVGDLRIDIAERVVTVRDERVKLSPHEFDLLRVLVQNRGKLLTHRALLREVWGPAYQVEAHYLHVYVSHLRKKIEPDPSSPRYLLTEPGAGYRFVDPADDRL